MPNTPRGYPIPDPNLGGADVPYDLERLASAIDADMAGRVADLGKLAAWSGLQLKALHWVPVTTNSVGDIGWTFTNSTVPVVYGDRAAFPTALVAAWCIDVHEAVGPVWWKLRRTQSDRTRVTFRAYGMSGSTAVALAGFATEAWVIAIGR